LKELHNAVVPKVANKWYELGIQLLNPSQISKLDEILSSYSTAHHQGCIEMLNLWLQTTPEASWENLIQALKQPSLELLSIANEVEKEVRG